MTARPNDGRLEDLLLRFSGLLAATVRRVCPRDLGIDFQDIEQEARVRLWRALGRATEPQLAASYVQKVAATAAIDAIRAARSRRDRIALADLGGERDEHEEVAIEDVSGRTPEDLARRRELSRQVKLAIDSLSSNRGRAVRFHLWGFSSPEIAHLTGWSETKIRSLISRGLGELRERLGEKGIDVHAGE